MRNREKVLRRHKEHYYAHREEILARCKEYRRRNHAEVLLRVNKCVKTLNLRQKIEALTYYGNGKLACVKCGFKDIKALSIDHIYGGGKAHIKSIHKGKTQGHIYHWLIKQGFPIGYQTLCMNCQWIKRADNNEGGKYHG